MASENHLYLHRTGQDPPTIFAGSLSPSTTERDLKRYFSTFGKVLRAKLILDIETGKSKQCALIFVECFETVNSILAFKSHLIDGRVVRLDLANDDRKHTKCFVENTLFIGNIKLQTTEESVLDYFESIGKVIGFKMFKLCEHAKSLNAIINFGSKEAVDMIMSRPNKHKLGGRHLRCSYYKPKDEKDLSQINDSQDSFSGVEEQVLQYDALHDPKSKMGSSGMNCGHFMACQSVAGNSDIYYQGANDCHDFLHLPSQEKGYQREPSIHKDYSLACSGFTYFEPKACHYQSNEFNQPWKDRKWKVQDQFVLAIELETDPLFLTFCASIDSEQR